MRWPTPFGKPLEEMFRPTPGRCKCTVHKEQWRTLFAFARVTANDFKGECFRQFNTSDEILYGFDARIADACGNVFLRAYCQGNGTGIDARSSGSNL